MLSYTLSVIMVSYILLTVIMLTVILPIVISLSFIMLNVNMQSVIRQSVVLLCVAWPSKWNQLLIFQVILLKFYPVEGKTNKTFEIFPLSMVCKGLIIKL
jgi:hypothetical protein